MCHQLPKSQETIPRITVNHNRIHNQDRDLLDFPSCEDCWLCTVSHSCGACEGFASASQTVLLNNQHPFSVSVEFLQAMILLAAEREQHLTWCQHVTRNGAIIGIVGCVACLPISKASNDNYAHYT